MTQKEFRNLFDSIRCSEELTARMEELLSEPPAGEFAESVSGVTVTRKRSRWAGYAGLAACLLLVTGGAVYFLGQERIPAVRPDPDSHPETSVQTEQTMLTEHNAQNTGITETVPETAQKTEAETTPNTSRTPSQTIIETSDMVVTETVTVPEETSTEPLTEYEETTTTTTTETVPEVSESWQKAYLETAESFAQNPDFKDVSFSLIYFDEDDVPELAVHTYLTTLYLYTYDGGEAIELIDGWSYGAMGNTGYSYVPYANSLQNYNHDYAGLLGYTSYMSITPEKTLEVTDVIETWNFNDLNGNGMPDEGEYDNELSYTAYYVDGVEITAEEAAAYAKGEYIAIGAESSLTLEELRAELGLT